MRGRRGVKSIGHKRDIPALAALAATTTPKTTTVAPNIHPLDTIGTIIESK